MSEIPVVSGSVEPKDKVRAAINDMKDRATPLGEHVLPTDPNRLERAMRTDPDRQAEIYQVSAQRRVPFDVVDRNLDVFQRKERIAQIDPKGNPLLVEFLSRRENAEVAHDDIETLGALEKTLGVAEAGLLQFPERVLRGAGEFIAAGGRAGEKAIPEFIAKPLAEIDKYVPEVSKLFTGAAGLTAQVGEHLLPLGEREGHIVQTAMGLAEVGSQIVTYMVSPQLAATSLFLSGVEQQAQRQDETGTKGDSWASDLALVNGGLWTTLTEKAQLDYIMKWTPPAAKSWVMAKLRSIGTNAGREAVQEVIESAGQGLIEKFSTNPDAEIFEGWKEQATVAGSVGAVIGALLPGKRRAPREQATKDTVDAVVKSANEQDTLDEVFTLAQQSKSAKRPGGAYERFVDSLPNNTLLVEPEAFEGIGGLPAYVADQIDGTGSPVKISLAEFTRDAVMGPEVMAAIRPHVRLSQSSFTQAELESGDAVSNVRNMINEASEAADTKTKAQQAWQDVQAQIVATGRMDKTAAKYSSILIPEFVTTIAQRRGVDVDEVVDLMGLKVEKAPPPTFDDKPIITEYTSGRQKATVRQQKQKVYEKAVNRQDMAVKLRDCING